LQHLIACQQAFSFVPAEALEHLVRAIDVTKAQLLAAVDFYAFLHLTPRGAYDILFSDNITDRMLGNRRLMKQLCGLLGVTPERPRADGRVTVGLTSCTGMCDQAPALLVNGYAVTRLDDERIRQIADLVNTRAAAALAAGVLRGLQQRAPAGPAAAGSRMPRCRAAALKRRGGDAVLAEIERAGLRGRGGAGFTTALKWRFCREAEHPDKVVVCNADEGEPGTFKDRVLLTAYADLVVEGMTLCAGITKARQGFIYLRGEYRYLLEHLEAVLQRRREQGLLGKGLRGRGGRDRSGSASDGLRLRHPDPSRRRCLHLRRGIGADRVAGG
jgi:[NiFe] hydrogenase diaphorase moiety large subunit